MSINWQYWLFTIAMFVVLGYLTLLAIWEISKNKKGLFFTNIREGTGTFIMDGGKAGRIILVMRGRTIAHVEEKRYTFDNEGKIISEEFVRRDKIIEGSPTYSPGIFGWLERSYGIFCVGLPPKSRMNKKFKWSEWKLPTKITEVKGITEIKEITKIKENVEETSGKFLRPWRREETTNFFYAQSFPYGVFLEAAECGGTKDNDGKEIGGGLSVNIEIGLFVRIVYPRVAIFENEDWFDQLMSVVLDHARLYVGKNTYEGLRSQKVEGETSAEKLPRNEFSEYVMKLNKYASIGKTYESIVDALGVEIVGAFIRKVDLSEESKSRLDSTTQVYDAQQRLLATNLDAEGAANTITKRETALTNAIIARVTALKEAGREGELVLNGLTLTEVSRGGNTIVASNGKGMPIIINSSKQQGG